jgi:hypothetical protein
LQLTSSGKGKIIDGSRICNELGFEYQYPDPLVMPQEVSCKDEDHAADQRGQENRTRDHALCIFGFFRQVADAVKAGKGEAQDCRPGNHRDNMRIARPEWTSARQRTSAFTFKYAINNHALTQGRADIIVGAMHEPPSSSEFGFSRLGDLEQVFAVAPHHPLALEEEPLNRRIIKRYRAIVVGDTAQAGASTASQLLDEQEAITVFDFKTKLELQISGLGCGYLPRYLAQRFLDSGALIEKKVVAQTLFEPVWIGWNEQTAGLASGWWRDEILANSAIAGVYAKSDDGKSAI